MKNIIRFALILFLVNLVAASILAVVYNVTKTRIEAQQRLIEKESIKQVMPEEIGNRLEPITKGGIIKYWNVFKGSDFRPVGYIFIAKKYGYSSVIEMMVGMKKDGTITGVRVLSQNETPGLGAKIVEILSNRTLFNALKEVFSKKKAVKEQTSPYFTEQFKNKNIKDIELSKNGIHAITGATISSRAVVDGIRQEGSEILNDYVE